MISDIKNELNNILQKPWSKKEYDLYLLLVNLTNEYKNKVNIYNWTKEDKPKLQENFISQPWYESVYDILLTQMQITNYVSEINSSVDILNITLEFDLFIIIFKSNNINCKITKQILFYNKYNKKEYLYYFNKSKMNYTLLKSIIMYKNNKELNEHIIKNFIKELILYYL
jgi:hypothetical protein